MIRPETDSAPETQGTQRQQGSVLIAVLAIIMLLSFIILRFVNEAVEDLEYRSIFNEPSDVRVFGYSVLEATLATIQEVALIDDEKLYAPEQGWNDPIRYAEIPVPDGWEVSVHIQDESGKLPLNTLSEARLNKLFEETLDLDFGTSRELSSVLIDWIDADSNRRLNGAESDAYQDRDPPYLAANGPLQSLDELRLLEVWDETFFDENGQPNELFDRLSSLVTVVYDGPVNLNAANANTLELLALEGGWDDSYLFDGLDQPYLTTLPASAESGTTSVETSLLRIEIRVLRGNVPFTINALVSPEFASTGNSSETGQSDPDAPKTGSIEEQQRLRYPFTVLQLSEYSSNPPKEMAARYSTVDIEGQNHSF